MRIESEIPTTKYGIPLLTRKENKEAVLIALAIYANRKYYRPKSFAFWHRGMYYYAVIKTGRDLWEVKVRPSTAGG